MSAIDSLAKAVPEGMKRCSKCGEVKEREEFYRKKSWGKRCWAAVNHANYEKNREERLKKDRANRERNRERIRERDRIYREKNRSAILKRKKACYKKNRETILLIAREKSKNMSAEAREKRRASQRRSRKKNINTVRARGRRWVKDNPEKICANAARRRARKRALLDDWTTADMEFAEEWWEGKCAYCGLPQLNEDLFAEKHWDHFIPVSKGGPTIPANMIPACHYCNLSMNNKDAREWAVERFGERKAKRVIAKIEKFFGEVRQVEA